MKPLRNVYIVWVHKSTLNIFGSMIYYEIPPSEEILIKDLRPFRSLILGPAPFSW